jgi:oligo-1,6-glucosidase
VEQRIAHADMLRYMRRKSRDNSRTPMHWNSGFNAGFSTGSPWIMLNPNYREINAEEQTRRADSVFKFYQTLIQLRAQMEIITLGNFELLLPDDPDLFVYTRAFQQEELLVVCNFSCRERAFAPPQRFKDGKLLLSNEEVNEKMGPFGAAVYYRGLIA